MDEGSRATRGSTITLHLKEKETDFANAWRLKSIIKKHSNYLPVPVEMPEMDVEGIKKDGMWERVNETKAIWSKAKTDVKDEEYKEFYQSLTFDTGEPLSYLHLNIEGATSFKALLYIPKAKPFQIARPDEDYGPKLYSQKVMILENSKELLPVWLRFVRGVVETSDLSLNVSREMLQNDQSLARIQKSLVKKVLDELTKQLKNNREEYEVFHKHFGEILKEGIHYNHELKQDIAHIVLFRSLVLDRNITLQEYLDAKLADQKEIYYLTGSDLDQLKQSPYLEKLKEKGYDVLLMDDPIDEWVVQSLSEYGETKLVNTSTKDLDIKKEEETQEAKEEIEKKEKDMKEFFLRLKSILGKDTIESVHVSDRLVDSPAVLTVASGGMTRQMEDMMRQMGQDVPPSKKTLEVNADHALILAMKKEFDTDPTSSKLEDMTYFLRDQSILAEGGKIEDMHGFIVRMNKIAGQYLS